MLLTYIIYALYKEPMKTEHKTTEPLTSHLYKDEVNANNLNEKELNHNSPLHKKAIDVLEMLSDILCNTQNRSFIEKFSKVITVKWLLLLLSDRNSRCVIYSFRILSQLMILKGTSYISKFLPKTHYFLLIKLYLKKWWNNIDIWKIAFCLFFGTDILNIKGNADIKNFDEFLQLLLNKNKNIAEIYCFEMYDVILAMLESGAYNLKLFQKYINSTKDDMNIYLSSINVTRRRSNSLSAIYSKTNKNNFEYNHIHNFKKTNYYESFDILLYVIRFIKNMYLSIRCFKENILSPYFIEKLLYIVYPLIFTKDHIETKVTLNSRNSFHISNKNIIIDTLPFENDHIPTLWKLDYINNSFSKCFIETVSDKKNISLIYLKSTITKKNKSSISFKSKLLKTFELNNEYDITSICEILLQLVVTNIIDSIIISSKKYILKLNILIPLCFFGNQIYIESYILYTTLIKLHKIIQNQLDKLNEISVLSNICIFSKDCLNCALKGHFFICEHLLEFLIFILEHIHKINIKKQKKIYGEFFINIQQCFHNIWKLIIQQKFHEISSIFDQSVPSDYNIADTFLNIHTLDLKYFLSWVNENKYILNNTFFKYLNTSWNHYLENQLRNWKEIILLDEQARNDRQHIQKNRIIRISDIFIKHESILSNLHKNLIILQHKKIEKYIQDQIDLDRSLDSVWSKIIDSLTEEHCIFESNKEKKWKLDFTEGRSRMRKKMKSDTNQNLIIQSEVQQKIPIDLYKAEVTDGRNINEDNREILKIFHDFKNNTDQINSEKAISSTIQSFNHNIENPNQKANDLFEDDKSRKILRNLEYGDYIIEIHNISRINGLNAYEGILFLGKNNLYLMDNYFQKSNGEITTVWDPTIENERDLYIQLLSGKDISKKKTVPFQSQHKTRKWSFDQIVSVYRRKFLFRDVGLELFFADGQSYLITLSIKEREHVYNKLLSKLSQINYRFSEDFLINSEFTDTIKSQTSITKLSSRIINMFNSTHPSLKKWKEGKISNFHYLMIINTLTGRTYNDLTQYPIFPWVLADYTSEELDLTNPKSFRDFSKPMGAQNPLRRSEFEKRFKSFQEIRDSSQPPFHYGTHYSSAMIVCSYLIRLRPFVDSYLLLQGGSFDHADRLFYSIEKAWLSSSQENMADVRELIPEFFYLPEFLVNSNNYKFGKKQGSNEIIDSVILPPWAKGDPKLFIKKHREALECDYVSEHLNEWIDLIFGFKQQGELAVKATNIFHHLSYQGSIDIDKIKDPLEKIATIGIIYNFGQTPNQIFQQPHPKRACNSKKYITATKIPYLGKYEKNISSLIQAIMHLRESDFSIKTIIYLEDLDKIIGCSSNCMYILSNINICLQWDIIGSDMEFYNRENKKIFKSFHKLHLKKVTCACFIEPYTLITGSNDCIIYIWSIMQEKTINLKLKNYLRGHFKPIISLDSSKSFSIIVSGSEDGLVIEWDLNRACYVRTLEKNNSPIQCISINDANGDIAACSEMTISIWTINGDLLLRQNIGFNQNDIIFSCKFYEGINYEWLECDLIFTGHNFGIVQIWNISWKTKDGKLIRELINIKTLQHYDYTKDSLLVSKITALYPSGKTRSLFTGDSLGNVYIWNLPDTVYKSHYLSTEEYNNCFICKTTFAIIDIYIYQPNCIKNQTHMINIDIDSEDDKIDDKDTQSSINGNGSSEFRQNLELNYEDDEIDRFSENLESSESDSKCTSDKSLSTKKNHNDNHHSIQANSYDIIPTFTAPHSTSINIITATSCMRWIFTGGNDGYIRKFDFFSSINGKIPLTVAQRQPFVDSVVNAGVLLSYWENNDSQNSLTSISTDSYHKLSPVYCLAVNKQALWMLSGIDTGVINLQSVRHDEGKILATMKKHISPVSVLELSSCETKVLSGGWDKNVYQWDLNTGVVSRSYDNHTGQISTIAYRPIFPIAIASTSNSIKYESEINVKSELNQTNNSLENFSNSIFNNKRMKKKNISNSFENINDYTNDSDLNNELIQNKNEFIVSGIDGSITIWDERQLKYIAKLGIPNGTPPWCMNACWSADGKYIYAGRRNGTVDEFSMYSALDKPLRSIKLPLNSGPVSAVHSMPNGKHLICASYDNIRMYDLNGSSKIPFLIIPGHYGGVISSIYIDNTCKYMLTASGNRGWDGNYTETLLGYEIEYL
ncbi:hypothetical protein MERGE_000130 [Pneumocystis wakefieldiae]|uniref:Uncharacterized protein n=1 Tax=Pneumocystis wakefieldiae TaxID=38082 RepID=A0A899FVN7_9ASCO|nr:hypothetical protein MERGE_000130 [Pneumocystis wakefieldiae]